jgi:hypothetical protein
MSIFLNESYDFRTGRRRKSPALGTPGQSGRKRQPDKEPGSGENYASGVPGSTKRPDALRSAGPTIPMHRAARQAGGVITTG